MINIDEQFKKKKVEIAFEQFQKDQERNFQPSIFYKAFLRPFQIVLKTWETTSRVQKIGCLPFGLRQVVRKSISGNVYNLSDFNSIESLKDHEQNDFAKIFQKKNDNMISLMKKSEEKQEQVGQNQNHEIYSLDVAICISMYSEDSSMLYKTLSGVKKNISHFVDKDVSADRIGVFVIMDGIQHIHESMDRFYQELENENGMHLSEKKEKKIQNHDFLFDGEIEKDEGIPHWEMVFSDEEYNDLYDGRFISRKSEYLGIKNLLKEIENLEKLKNISFDSISGKLQDYFIEEAKNYHKKLYAEDKEQIQKKTRDFFIKNYVGNDVYQKLIREAINKAKKQSLVYFEKREKMALVNTFRVEIEQKKQKQNGYLAVQNQQNSNEYENIRSQKKFMNLFMVTKYKNGGKLSSHNWFFNGFCKELKTKYAVLLDVGLIPNQHSLVKMYEHMEESMENHQKIGGVCGYMGVRRQSTDEHKNKDFCASFFQSCVDIQKAQVMQYHYSHLVEKPFESIFKFVHVLPGAFSGYRMEALQPDQNKDSALLQEYFKSLNSELTIPQPSTFTICQIFLKILLPDFIYTFFYPRKPNSEEQMLYNQNVYLAEDRTLCIGIRLNGYKLQYLPDAYSKVDPMQTILELVGQRKRWINGSFFAFQQVKKTYGQKKCFSFLKLQILILTLLNYISNIAPSLFIVTTYITIDSIVQRLGQLFLITLMEKYVMQTLYAVEIVLKISVFILIMLLLSLIFFSMFLNHKNQYMKKLIISMSIYLGLISLFIYGILITDIIQYFSQERTEGFDQIFSYKTIFYLVIAMLFLHVLPIFTYISFSCKKCPILLQILSSLISYLFFIPTYLIILNIYALARIDDISWGTKGLNQEFSATQQTKKQSWKRIKIIQVSKFLFWNIIITFILLLINQKGKNSQHQNKNFKTKLFSFIVFILFFSLFIKSILAVIYFIKYKCCKRNQTINPSEVTSKSIWGKFDKLKGSIYEEIKERTLKKTNIEVPQEEKVEHIVFIQNKKKQKQEKNILQKYQEQAQKKKKQYKFLKKKRIQQSRKSSIIQRDELKNNLGFLRKKNLPEKKEEIKCQSSELYERIRSVSQFEEEKNLQQDEE